MTVISVLGKSWLILNIPLHSPIIYHRDTLKAGQAVNRDLHFAVASTCVRVSLRYVTIGAWCELTFKLNCFVPRGFFCEWCLCVYIFSLFFICLPDSLFVPDFNGQKKSDLIAVALLIQIYMIALLLNVCVQVSVHHCRCQRFFHNSFAPVYTEQWVHKGCNFGKISALGAKFIQFIIENDLLNVRRRLGACHTRP